MQLITSRLVGGGLRGVQSRSISSGPSPVKHLLSMSDLTMKQTIQLVQSAKKMKTLVKEGYKLNHRLRSDTVALMFSKRSTRTRVSTEAAVTRMGAHPMFLGKNDIQLGVNESLFDTSKIISSMVSAMVARVGPHSDVVELAKHSSVPVINALSDEFHPLQAVADYLTIFEHFSAKEPSRIDEGHIIPRDLKIAWIGDSNNVLFDMAIAGFKLGAHIAVASPEGYGIPQDKRDLIKKGSEGTLTETTSPEEALRDADVVVTDTWVSMGQEADSKKRLQDFAGYQITNKLVEGAGAKPGWVFMHCMPRHPEEVADEVFYSDRSLVFQEGENRLWAALAVLETIVAKKGLTFQFTPSERSLMSMPKYRNEVIEKKKQRRNRPEPQAQEEAGTENAEAEKTAEAEKP